MRSALNTAMLNSPTRPAAKAAQAAAQLGSLDVDGFNSDLLDGNERVLLARLEGLRQRGFSVEALCLDLLAPAANRLGTLWNDDRCDFASVTVAVSQLQRLMRLIGIGSVPSAQHTGAGLHVLLAQPPQEQHSFGLAMVAEFFRCAGWGLSGGLADAHTSAVTRARARHVDVVGFSVGSEAQLDWLRREITAVRNVSVNPRVVVMVGGPLVALHPHWAPELGADLCMDSARNAPALAEQLVRSTALAEGSLLTPA